MAYTPYQPTVPGMYPSIQAGYNPAPYQPNYPATSNLTGRYVTSEAEARAAQVDFLSPINLFPDLTRMVVYAKVLNRNTGAVDFLEFKLPQPPVEVHEAPYPTISAFAELEARVKSLEDLKGGEANV